MDALSQNSQLVKIPGILYFLARVTSTEFLKKCQIEGMQLPRLMTNYLGDSGTINKSIDWRIDGAIVKPTKKGHLFSEPIMPFRPKTILKKIPRVIANWLNIPMEPSKSLWSSLALICAQIGTNYILILLKCCFYMQCR